MRKILLSAAVLIILLSPAALALKGEDMTYNVYTLWSDITNKKIAFEFDDPLQVKGIVVETGISIWATPYVSLSNEKDGKVYATCVLPRADTLKLKDFKKGEEVSMAGNFYTFVDKAVIKKCSKLEEK